MAADLTILVPEFREQVEQLLINCKNRGVIMRPNETVRTPVEQAQLWRQSRTIEEITRKIADLNANNAPFLADCIREVGPQHGDPVTNAVPGLSWHQWGEALDCFWVVNGKAEWSLTRLINGINGYQIYAGEARKLGLEAGFFWHSFPDSPHVQLRKAGSPLNVFPLSKINDVMEERFAAVPL